MSVVTGIYLFRLLLNIIFFVLRSFCTLQTVHTIMKCRMMAFHQFTSVKSMYQKIYFTTEMQPNIFLTLKAPIATKVVCFSHLLKCLRSLYGKQCGPRSDCSYSSSLFWVHAVCSYTQFVSNVRQLFAADDFSRRHFQMHFFLGALRVKVISWSIHYAFNGCNLRVGKFDVSASNMIIFCVNISPSSR